MIIVAPDWTLVIDISDPLVYFDESFDTSNELWFLLLAEHLH